MRAISKIRNVGVVAASTIGLLLGSTLAGGPSAGAALPDGASFGFTGAAQTYVVPDGVCAVEIVASGAQGGQGDYDSDLGRPSPGLGGEATSTVAVTPGETLQVNVGGRGEDYDAGAQGGWNGGGDGSSGGTEDLAAGGGGASDVRQGGTGLDARVIVGGGGGGAGYSEDGPDSGAGGNGGNPATPGTGEGGGGSEGGGAASTSAGGTGGAGNPAGGDGSLGAGGDGASSDGGGGGGGLYGGGGGGAGSFAAGGGGGGGSSLGDSTSPGVNEGDGSVTVTPVADCAEPTTTTAGSTTTAGPTTTGAVPPTTSQSSHEAKPARPVVANPSYTG